MGYTTNFYGRFTFDKPLTEELFKTMKDFADERHEGEEYPSYYCQWIPSEDLLGIEWDGGEKFYGYEEWLVYIIDHFLVPNTYHLSGDVRWEGEENKDIGRLIVVNNLLEVKKAKIVWE
jgi:hypothetical protein